MGIPRVYNQATEGAVVSYDWFELSDGTGYKTFYGFSTDRPSTSGELQLLTTSPLYSDSKVVSGTTTVGISLSGVYTSKFNLSKNIKGNSYISFGWWSNTNDMFPFCKIYKTEGSTDTLIGEASGALVSNAPLSLPKVTTLRADLPLTHFKKNDILKLKVGITAAAGGAGAISNFGQDPMNRDDLKIVPSTDNTTTKIIFNVPFVPDL